MTPDEAAAIACADLAVQRFARMCKEHPRLEEDPVCVIATLEEEYRRKLQADVLEQILVTPERNGKHHDKPESRNGDQKPSRRRHTHIRS